METRAIKADIYFLLKMKYIFTAAYLIKYYSRENE